MKGVSHFINFDVPWQPDDYIHRIGRTGRAGATGIAIMLATPADAEAVANIEKLTGIKLPRVGKAQATPVEEAAPKAEKPARGRRKPAAKAAEPEAREARPAREPREERAPRPARESRQEREPRPEREPRAERAPRKDAKPEKELVVEDLKPEWNGPLPSFLSFGAS